MHIRTLAIAALLAAGAAHIAHAYNDDITKDEVKILIEDTMAQEPQHSDQIKSRGIDAKALSAKITADERAAKERSVKMLDSGKDPTGSQLEDMLKQCGLTLHWQTDIAVIKDLGADNTTAAIMPYGVIVDGLQQACATPADKAWVQHNIKAIHYRLAKHKLDDNNNHFELELDAATKTLFVGTRMYGASNEAAHLADWIRGRGHVKH